MALSDQAIEAGRLGHYRDPTYYDQAYGDRRHDAAYYAALAAAVGGPVLELGVGTGRIARTIAKHGIEVLGIDDSEPMLARARAQTKQEGLEKFVRFRRGDFRKLRLKGPFSLVIAPFNAFMHLYTRKEWELTLRGVHRCLRPRGTLAFDVLLPDPRELAADPAKVFRSSPVTIEGRRYRYGELFEYDPARQVQLVTMVFEAENDPDDVFVQPLSHRQCFPKELEALVSYNGFRIEAHHGGFQGEPLADGCESQLIVAKKRAIRRG
ncbi:MAG: class I SAM-dependent methyltransferase [Myxococcota bacterium]